METKSRVGKISGKDRFRSIMGQYGIGVVVLILVVVIALMESRFFTLNNLMNVTMQITINGLLCYGLCLCITTGGIDLTVGAQLALTSCIIGHLITNMGIPMLIAVPAGVLVATFFGFLNGLLIAKFNMFPFVVTLAMQLIIRGLSQVITGGRAVMLTDSSFTAIYSGKLGPVPYPIVIFIVITILMHLLLHWTKFGRYIFAVGGNENAAIASGVSRFKVLVGVYTISGLLAGIASVLYTAKTGSAQSNIGVGYETDAIAAAVLGGTSFAGGIATIPGAVLGIFIIGLIYNGMNMIGVSSYFQSIVKGAIIIGAVMIDMVMNRNKH